MKNFKQTIEKLAEDENIQKLDEYYNTIVVLGTKEEKTVLAEGYYEIFLQCQYDNMCGKFNKEEYILELFNWLDKIKKLNPSFNEYHASMGYTYEMLEDAVEDVGCKDEYVTKSIESFYKQLRVTENSDTIYVHIAKAKYRFLEYSNKITAERLLEEILPLLIKALRLERLPENTKPFYKFNGTSISSYLSVAYQILELSLSEARFVHEEFMRSFEEIIVEYAKTDTSVYCHWADMLFRITEWQKYEEITVLPEREQVFHGIWADICKVLSHVENEELTDQHLISDYGHLFSRLALKQRSIHYHEVSLKYHLKGIECDEYTWTFPTYASNELRYMAHIYLEDGNVALANRKFLRAIDILKRAANRISDLQICDHLGDFYFEYAKLFEEFKNKETIRKALNQYKLAEIDGKGYYTTPYYGQVKCYFHLHDFDGCLNTLQKSKDQFSNEYHIHDFEDLKRDKDFEEIIPLLEHLK